MVVWYALYEMYVLYYFELLLLCCVPTLRFLLVCFVFRVCFVFVFRVFSLS